MALEGSARGYRLAGYRNVAQEMQGLARKLNAEMRSRVPDARKVAKLKADIESLKASRQQIRDQLNEGDF